MLPAAVTGVEHRARRILGRDAPRAIARVTHDQQIGVRAHHPHGIGQTFALGSRAGVHVGGADDRAAQPMHRRLEAQARARRGLVEQRRHDQTVGGLELFAAFQGGGEFIGQAKDPLDFRQRQVVDRN
jgi:hypothetical protein